MNKYRKEFPILKKIVYLDSAAAGLKPKKMVKAISNFYLKFPINPHSKESKLGIKVCNKINETRSLVANLIDASNEEIIFTSGSTESLNMVALMVQDFLKKDDEILLSKMNHIANISIWNEVCKKTKAKIVYSEKLIDSINDKTKIVAFSQQNNSLHKKIDIKKLYKKVKKHNAFLINDAAQAIVHKKVSLTNSDVVVFSGNKIYGPTGIGILAIKKEFLYSLNSKKQGGGIFLEYSSKNIITKKGNAQHEAGTSNTAGIIGLGESIKWFNKILEKDKIFNKELAKYAYDKLKQVPNIKIYSKRGETNILFNIDSFHAQDVVSYLGNKNIILRAGDHCCKLLNEIVEFKDSIRLSLGIYNNKKDIDIFVNTLINSKGNFIDYV